MTDSRSGDERRHYQRIPFIAEVKVSSGQAQWSCALEDISLKGLLIHAPSGENPIKGQSYNIDLVLGEGTDIAMQAKISHATEEHWGLEWETIGVQSLTHLRRLLELNMGDPQEMHRELAELG